MHCRKVMMLSYLPKKRWKAIGEETVEERLSLCMMPPSLPSSWKQRWVSLPHNQHDLSTQCTSLRMQSASCQMGHWVLWTPGWTTALCAISYVCVLCLLYKVLHSDYFQGPFVCVHLCMCVLASAVRALGWVWDGSRRVFVDIAVTWQIWAVTYDTRKRIRVYLCAITHPQCCSKARLSDTFSQN